MEITLAQLISLISIDSANQQLFVEFSAWDGNAIYRESFSDDNRINIRSNDCIWFNRVEDAWSLISQTSEEYFAETVQSFSFARDGKFTIYC